MENEENKKAIIESIKNHFSKTSEEDKNDEIASDDVALSIALIVAGGCWGSAISHLAFVESY